eukprot:814680-Rhodomonas_salina.6
MSSRRSPLEVVGLLNEVSQVLPRSVNSDLRLLKTSVGHFRRRAHSDLSCYMTQRVLSYQLYTEFDQLTTKHKVGCFPPFFPHKLLAVLTCRTWYPDARMCGTDMAYGATRSSKLTR